MGIFSTENVLSIKSGYWYLATVYSKHPDGIEVAFQEAAAAAGQLLQWGIPTFSPIAHTHPIAIHGGIDPFSHEIFLPLDEQMMEHAHGILVVMMPNWEESVGISHERAWFRERNRPEVLLSFPDLKMVD